MTMCRKQEWQQLLLFIYFLSSFPSMVLGVIFVSAL